MGLEGNPRVATVRWGKMFAWLAAWALVVAAGHYLPPWVGIAAAVAVFGAQLLLAPGRAACHLPNHPRDRVTKRTPPHTP